MKINAQKVNKFQMGGAVPPEGAPVEQAPPAGAPVEQGGAPAPEGGGDPLAEIAQIAAQALQNQDCQAAMAVCEAFLQLMEQASGGGAAPEQPAEPTFQKKGGKLVRKG